MMKVSRQSNMELLRLVAMFMVMTIHANPLFLAGGMETVMEAKVESATLSVIEGLCIVAVNVFVLISGWFGIRAKWQGMASILFSVLFYSVLAIGIYAVFGLPVPWKEAGKSLWFGSSYWFVPSYLILYCFAPVLNSFVERTGQQELRNFLIMFFVLEIVYGFFRQNGDFIHGSSAISFIGLYLLARYVRLYPSRLTTRGVGFDLTVYFICTVLSGLGFWLSGQLYRPMYNAFFYSNPLVIIGALYLMLAFSKMHFSSRVVNWLATSAFAIYLVHQNNLVIPHFSGVFQNLYGTCPFGGFLLLSAGALLVIGLGCILLDKIRIMLWKLIVPAK